LSLKVFLTGRVAVETDGIVLDEARFPGRQGRLLFAYLVAEQGRPVPHDELAEALWGESPPATWEKALTVLVSKLRGLLVESGINGSALTGAFGCYRLDLPDGTWVDVIAAGDAVREAEGALAAGDLEQAKSEAAAAASFLGEPFLPGEEGSWIDEKRRELDELRTRALEVLADAHLHSGAAHEAVKWAKQTVVLEPFRETGYRRLMEAHAAAGNRAEALRVYERCRRLLADELGAYPSPETEAIYRALLEAPTSSRPRRQTREATRPTKRKGRFALLSASVVAAAAVVAVVLATEDAATQAVSANSVVALDASGSIAHAVPVGARPDAMASGAGSLWVANLDDQTVTRVDPVSDRTLRTIPIGGAPMSITAAASGVWVTDSAGHVSRIDTTYDRVATRRSFAVLGSEFGGSVRPTLAAFGSLWVVDPDGLISRIDPDSERRLGSVEVGNDPSAVAAGAGSIWVVNQADGTATRIDPTTLVTTTIPVGQGPTAIAVNAAGAWITDAGDNTLVRVDTDTNAVAGSTQVGDEPAAVLASPTTLWVANAGDGTVMRLDPRSGRVKETVRVGGTPTALASAAGKVWVTVAPALQAASTGGVLRVAAKVEVPSLDPAQNPVPATSYPTCANLVTYPDQPAPEGSHIVPEVAESVPTPTAGGTTYTFRIRPGFRFSPPSNEPVTAATFKATIERVIDPRMKSLFADQLRDVSNVVARGHMLTITLSHPDGSFLANLASGAACAVPRDTPVVPSGINDVPSAGPYYIASYAPNEQLVLRRNPNYHGDRPRQFDEIVFELGVDSSRALREIEAGRADYALADLPRAAGPELLAAYGPGSKAAREGHQQYFITEANAVRYLHMNASRPLFSNVRLRRAVNFAIDRPALVEQARRFAEVNPFNAGEPTDDYLPPSIAGAGDFHVYPVDGPDLTRAKQLAGHIHAAAIMYTPNVPPWIQEAQIIRRDLQPLGIDVQVKEFPLNEFFTRISRRGEPFDLAVAGWWFFNTDPTHVIADLFDGRTIRASKNTDLSYFDDPAFDRKLDAAARLSGPKRYRMYDRLALELERDDAPVAAISVNASRDFFSARIGCQVYQPVYGIDLAALCLRR
jgi:ABC-type transport system substrate-binding protein/DNA-binding SARP family transcriptional activator